MNYNNLNFNLLTQNSKIKKTSKYFNTKLFNFSIIAYKSKEGEITCPFADTCIKFCYAQKGFYKMSEKFAEAKYQVSKLDIFESEIIKEIKQKKSEYIRVHDSGDYYSKKYLHKWLNIANELKDIKFYSYTNNVKQIKRYYDKNLIPNNFDFIFSDQGKQRHLIDKKHDRHTKIFQSQKELDNSKYIDSSNYDLFATKWFNKSNKVGLLIH